MTPANIVGMAAIKELDVIALTDHNSCKNCPAFLKLAKEYGVLALPGMELCTEEEVHVVCLFSNLEDALAFGAYVDTKVIPFPNNATIFGKQEIYNEEDEVIGIEPNLLINATTIGFEEVYDVVERYHGVMIPAHIDKSANSLLSNLGFVPPDSKFTCFEVKDMGKVEALRAQNPYLNQCKAITNSDSHYLETINEPVNFLHAREKTAEAVLEALRKGSGTDE